MGQSLTSGQKLHGALRTPRKLLAESVHELYEAQFIEAFGFQTARGGQTLELIVMRIVHMLLSENRSFISPKSLLTWVSSDKSVSTRREDRVWESMSLAFSALSMPAARIAGEQNGSYMVNRVANAYKVLF